MYLPYLCTFCYSVYLYGMSIYGMECHIVGIVTLVVFNLHTKETIRKGSYMSLHSIQIKTNHTYNTMAMEMLPALEIAPHNGN